MRDLPVFAADGAGIRLMKRGITADYIVGDLDSFYESDLHRHYPGERVVHDPDQETNDFEKILKFVAERDYESPLIIGFNGGIIEHTLNNWSVLIRYARRMRLAIFDRGRIGLPLFDSFIFNCQKGEILSLIPQPECRITTRNLHWELRGEWLALGRREGMHNIAETTRIEVDIHEGGLLLFYDARLPFAPEFR